MNIELREFQQTYVDRFVRELRKAARISAQVFPVPHLLPSVCFIRRNSRYHESKLVSRSGVSVPEIFNNVRC